MSAIIVLIALLVAPFSRTSEASSASAHRLLDALFLASSYSVDIGPGFPGNSTVTVLNFGLVNVVSADADTNQVDWILRPVLTWNDNRLRWSPAEFNGITSLPLKDRWIWKPDVVIWDLTAPAENIFGDAVITLEYTGQIVYKQAWRARTMCDVQHVNSARGSVCNMTLRSWKLDASLLNLDIDQARPGPDLTGFFQGSKYEVVDARVQKLLRQDSVDSFASVQYSFTIRKRSNSGLVSGFFRNIGFNA